MSSTLLAEPFAQHELLHLAAGRAREVVDRPNLLGPLLAGDASRIQMGLHLRELRTRLAGLQAKKRARPLPEAGVGRRDDRDLGHTLHPHQELFDLLGTDFLTA